ncbi:MAG: hypothetical protein ABI645_05010, partial [Pseudomonadota bacterium]
QTDYRTPGDAPVVARAPVEAERTPLAQSTAEPASGAVPERAADSMRTDKAVVQELPAPQPFPASPAAISPPSPPTMTEPSPPQLARNSADELEEINITGTRIQGSNNERVGAAPAAPVPPQAGGAAPGGAGAAALRTMDSMALLRQYFAAQYQSDAPHSVWLVLNAGGEVLQSGELAPGQRLDDLAPQLTRALGDRVPGPWQMQTLANARGQLIELAIARLP